MDEKSKALYKSLTGEKWEDLKRTIPKVESITSDIIRELNTKYPLVKIGHTAENATFNITEEERTHMHILGLPGEGKSKFIELMCRHDIDRLSKNKVAPGFCLIDSSDFGNTVKKVLRYCRAKKFTKVALVDPDDLTSSIGKAPTISIFGKLVKNDQGEEHYALDKQEAVRDVRNTFRILWESESFSAEARINKYLRVLTEALHKSGATLAELVFFTNKDNELYQRKRDAILSRLKPNDQARVTLNEVFFRMLPHVYQVEFGSTIRRLDPLIEQPLPVILGSNSSPMDFRKLIANGWVILCSLDPKKWDIPQMRFLGTLVINQIIQAQYGLVNAGRNIPYFLYIDEVGRYATETLSEVIDYKRTSNLKLIMAHQRYEQIKNKAVMDGLSSAGTKVLFYTERADRERMLKQMYYGDMEKQASEVFHSLEKQHAIIKVGKTPPRIIRLLDVPDIPPNKEKDQKFRELLYQQPWYKTKAEVMQEINERFKTFQPAEAHGVRPKRQNAGGAGAKQQPNRQTAPRAERGADVAGKGKGAASPKGTRTVPDDIPDSVAVLLGRRARKANKVVQDTPEEE